MPAVEEAEEESTEKTPMKKAFVVDSFPKMTTANIDRIPNGLLY